MSIRFSPVEAAPEFYTMESEGRFRRELESYLLRLSAEVNGVSSSHSTEASLASKRESLIVPRLGVETYGESVPLDSSYYMARKLAVYGLPFTIPGGGSVSWGTIQDWTELQQEYWAEDGTTGDIYYTGSFPPSGKRRFLVSYSFSITGYSSITYWNMFGRVTKKSPGGSHAVVLGSTQATNPYASAYAFYVYFSYHTLSSSVIVEISDGDCIAFQYGNSVSGAGTPTIVNQVVGDTDGPTISIVPVDLSS